MDGWTADKPALWPSFDSYQLNVQKTGRAGFAKRYSHPQHREKNW